MEFKKLTITEGLFAVIVISLILVTMTFSSPYYIINQDEYYKVNLEFQILSLGVYVLILSILLLLIFNYFKINTWKEFNSKVNLLNPLDVLIIVNCNVIFFAIGFILDHYLQTKKIDESYELVVVVGFVAFLVANLVALLSTAFINFNSPKFLSFGRFSTYNTFGIVYYFCWFILFFILNFLLLSEGYPFIAVSLLIFGLIKLNLLSHCSY